MEPLKYLDNEMESTIFYKEEQAPLHNRKGLKIKRYELLILSFLAKEKLLTSQQLLRLVHLYEPNKPINSLNNRIRKFEKYQLVGIRAPNIRLLGDSNKVFVRPAGYQLLVKYNFLPSSWANKKRAEGLLIRNLDHFLAIKEITVQSYIAALRYKRFATVHTSHYYLNNSINSIRPDALITLDKLDGHEDTRMFLNIEVDSGSEPQQTIIDKVQSYVAIAKRYPNDEHLVLFATIDQSLIVRNQSSIVGERRVANLKMILGEVATTLNNLHIVVLPLKDMRRWIDIFYAQPLMIYGTRKKEMFERIPRLLNILPDSSFPYQLKIQDKSNLLPKEVNSDKVVMELYKFISTSSNSHETVLILGIEKGNVSDHYLLLRIARLLERYSFRLPVTRIIALYPTREDAEKDIIGSAFSKDILITTTDEIGNAIITGTLTGFHQKLAFTKERVEF